MKLIKEKRKNRGGVVKNNLKESKYQGVDRWMRGRDPADLRPFDCLRLCDIEGLFVVTFGINVVMDVYIQCGLPEQWKIFN